MCQDSDTFGSDILDWSSTDAFSEVCLRAGMKPEEVHELIQELYSLPTRVRREFLFNRLRRKGETR
jgi:hypothetical protein